jgi:hypothetical protein
MYAEKMKRADKAESENVDDVEDIADDKILRAVCVYV